MVVALLLAVLQADAESRGAFEAIIRAGKEFAPDTERARQALAEIRAHQRFGAAYPPIQLITYAAKDRPTPEMLDEVSKILGVRFKNESIEGVILNPIAPRATVELRDAYPCEALNAVARSVGAEWWREGDSIVLSSGAFPAPKFLIYARHFKIEVESFTEERERGVTGEEKASAGLWLGIGNPYPCRLAGYKGVKFLEVMDDTGRSLAPDEQRETATYDTFRGLSSHQPLKGPAPTAKKLTRLRGVFRALFPERPATIEIPLAGDKREIPAPNLALALEKVSENGRAIRLTGRIGDVTKSHVKPEPGDFRLKGKDGRILAATGARSGQRESVIVELRFEIPAGFDAAALVVEYFQGTGEHEIPFDFKDVPIR